MAADGGLKKLSIAALARHLGLVPSASYRHFRNKHEIVDAMLRLVQSQLTGNVKAVCETTPNAIERLH